MRLLGLQSLYSACSSTRRRKRAKAPEDSVGAVLLPPSTPPLASPVGAHVIQALGDGELLRVSTRRHQLHAPSPQGVQLTLQTIHLLVQGLQGKRTSAPPVQPSTRPNNPFQGP